MGLSAPPSDGSFPFFLEDFIFSEALLLPENQPRSIQVLLSPLEDGDMIMKVYALTGEADWKLYTTGKIRVDESNSLEAKTEDLEEIRSSLKESVRGADYYARQNQLEGQGGVTFGPDFQCIHQIWRRDGEALAELMLPEHLSRDVDRYRIHPCLLDAVLQPITTALPAELRSLCFLPFNVGQLRQFAPIPLHAWSHVKIDFGGLNPETITCTATLIDSAGRVLVEISGVLLKRTSLVAIDHQLSKEIDSLSDSNAEIDDNFYQVVWEHSPIPSKNITQPPCRWILFADHAASTESVSGAVISKIRAAGDDYLVVLPADTYTPPTDGYAKINPRHPEDYRALWQDIASEPELIKVVHLWSLDLPPLDGVRSLVDDFVP